MSFVSKVISLRIKLCVQQGAQQEGKTKKRTPSHFDASLVQGSGSAQQRGGGKSTRQRSMVA